MLLHKFHHHIIVAGRQDIFDLSDGYIKPAQASDRVNPPELVIGIIPVAIAGIHVLGLEQVNLVIKAQCILAYAG